MMIRHSDDNVVWDMAALIEGCRRTSGRDGETAERAHVRLFRSGQIDGLGVHGLALFVCACHEGDLYGGNPMIRFVVEAKFDRAHVAYVDEISLESILPTGEINRNSQTWAIRRFEQLGFELDDAVATLNDSLALGFDLRSLRGAWNKRQIHDRSNVGLHNTAILLQAKESLKLILDTVAQIRTLRGRRIIDVRKLDCEEVHVATSLQFLNWAWYIQDPWRGGCVSRGGHACIDTLGSLSFVFFTWLSSSPDDLLDREDRFRRFATHCITALKLHADILREGSFVEG